MMNEMPNPLGNTASPGPNSLLGFGSGEPVPPATGGLTEAYASRNMGRAKETSGGATDMVWPWKTESRNTMDAPNSRY